ncbi:MAG: TolC family protein [Sphingobacteriales bacterium]|nr:TolC family protein [Sphingobacteriales bacterium]OJW04065.1 MAG: transporter [Sphingobacteriales bacterium 44-61]
MRKSRSFVLYLLVPALLLSAASNAQQTGADSLLQNASLPNVIQYALKRQPLVQQSLIDEQITALQVKSKLADWYPQINFNYLLQHNFDVQTNIIGGNPVKLGVDNTSAFQFGATQTIFNRDVLLALRSRNDVQLQARQQTTSNKIDVVVNVTKAFYAVLATQQQIKVVQETITRLERSLKDARAQYDAGVADKTDYKRATIALNNAIASRKATEESLKANTENLKAVMNYPPSGTLNIAYDSIALENAIPQDTLARVDIGSRIEYQQLQTLKRLQEANLKYNKWSFIPTLSANGAYNFNYLNDQFSKLYNQSYPNSYIGLTLGLPIFQGGKRKYNIKQAEWQLKRVDLDIVNLENSVNAEYTAAVAAYKSNLANFLAIKENVQLAQEVYDVIQLQYHSGIKVYLEVITAETDLRTAQINYFNALYSVLSSKVDVQRALGTVQY